MENAVFEVMFKIILSVCGAPKVFFTEVMGPPRKEWSQRDVCNLSPKQPGLGPLLLTAVSDTTNIKEI